MNVILFLSCKRKEKLHPKKCLPLHGRGAHCKMLECCHDDLFDLMFFYCNSFAFVLCMFKDPLEAS